MTALYTRNYDAAFQKIQAAQLAGALPDAAMIENSQTQQLAPSGALASEPAAAPAASSRGPALPVGSRRPDAPVPEH